MKRAKKQPKEAATVLSKWVDREPRKTIEMLYDNIEPEDRLDYFTGCLAELDRCHSDYVKEVKKRGIDGDPDRYADWMIWCDYEDIPEAIGDLFYHMDGDIEEILLDIRDKQEKLDREARDDYYELLRDYHEMVGGK